MKSRLKNSNFIISMLEGRASIGWAVLAAGLSGTWWLRIPIALVSIPIGLGTACG